MTNPHLPFDAIALDLDGTLLNSSHKLSEENAEALRKAHKLGVHLILASGRMTATIKPFWKQIGVPASIISYNGAKLLEANGNGLKTIFSENVSSHTRVEVIELCQRENHFLNIYANNRLYAFQPQGNWDWGHFYSNQTGANYAAYFTQPEGIPLEGITKMLIITSAEARDPLVEKIEKEFRQHCQIIKSNPEYTEFAKLDVSKGSALKKWSEWIGIPLSRVFAMGDAENDLEMLQEVGLGKAMKNATPGLRQTFPTWSTWSNDEDAVMREVAGIFGL